MSGIFEALWLLIKQVSSGLLNSMTVGDLYIPNTNIIGSKNVDGVSVSTYYNSAAGNTVDSASHNASQQVFDFYWGLSPYLHMVKPSTQFLRTWMSWIADALYGIDSFLTYLYVNLFAVMGLRSSYSPSSGFFGLVHAGQELGVFACIIATICYFGAMILAPNGAVMSKLKILFRNIILGAAIIGFLPTVSNVFIVGTQYEAEHLIGNGSTSGSGEHMDSLAADYFRQNVISVPHKITSMGLKPNGTPMSKSKNKSSSNNKGADMTYGIQVPESHNRIVYRPKSTFYIPSPNDTSKVGNKPIASKQVTINLYAMSDQERNSWNGLNDVSIPSFLHEYGSDDSIIDPDNNEDKYDKINKGQEITANEKLEEDAKSPRLRRKNIQKCESGHSKLNIFHTGACHVDNPRTKFGAGLRKLDNDYAYSSTKSFRHGNYIAGLAKNDFNPVNAYRNYRTSKHYVQTITPNQRVIQMINNLTIVAHAQAKQSKTASKIANSKTANKNDKQKSIKQTNKGNKQQTTKADNKSSENSDDNGIGLYNYQLDGDDDYASIDSIKQGFMSKHVSGGSMTSYYDKYKVCWFNIITGLLLLGFMLCAFIAKIATSFFKVSVMYISVGIFMYKAVSAPQAWKEFIKAFFGIYEMLFMDVLMLRVWLMACFAFDAVVSTIVTKAAIGATDLVTGGITLVCNIAMALTALHGVDAVDKIMGPGANSGASHSWGDALAAVTAMRTMGGIGRTAGRAVGAPFRMGGSAVNGVGSALGKHHNNSMRKKAATGQNAFQRAKGHIKNGTNALKHPRRALNGFKKHNPKTHFAGQASGKPTPKQERLAKKLNRKHNRLGNNANAVTGKHKNGTDNNKAKGKHFGNSANNSGSNDAYSDTTNGLNGENQDSDTGDNLDDSDSDTTGNDVDSDIDSQFGDTDSNSADNDNMANAKNSASIASRHAKASNNSGSNKDAFGNQKANNNTTGTQPKTTRPNPNSRKDFTTRTANGIQHTGNGLKHIGNGINRVTGNQPSPVTPVNHNNDTNTDGTVGQWKPENGIDGNGTNASASDNQTDAFGNSNTTGTNPDMSSISDASNPTSSSDSTSSSVSNKLSGLDKSDSNPSNSDNMSADNITPNHVANNSNSASSSSNSGHISNKAVGTAGNDVSSNVANNATGATGNTGSTTGNTASNIGTGNHNIKPNIRHQNLNVHHHNNGNHASQNNNINGTGTTGSHTITETTTTNSTDDTNPTNHFTGQNNSIDTPTNNNQSTTTTQDVQGTPTNNSGNNVVSNNDNGTGTTGQTIIHRHINNINDGGNGNTGTTTTTTNTTGGNPDNTTGNTISNSTPISNSGNAGSSNPSNNTTTTTNNGNNNTGNSRVDRSFDHIINMAHHTGTGNSTTTHFNNQSNGLSDNNGNTITTDTTTTTTNSNSSTGNNGTHNIHNIINHTGGNNTGSHTTIHRHIHNINQTGNNFTPSHTTTTTTTDNSTPNNNEPGDKDLYQSINHIASQDNDSIPNNETTTTNDSNGYNAFTPNNNQSHQEILGSDDDAYTPNDVDSDTGNTSNDENGGNDLTSGLFRGLTGDDTGNDIGSNDNSDSPRDFTGNHGNIGNSSNHLNGSNDYVPHTPHFRDSANWNDDNK